MCYAYLFYIIAICISINLDSIKASAEDLIERFSQMQAEYEESLLLHQDYMLDFDDEDQIKSILSIVLGSIIIPKKYSIDFVN